jgi:uncharacterized protein YggE
MLFTLCLSSYGKNPIVRTITLQGNSNIEVVPDTVTIKAMAETINLDLSKAVNINNTIIREARKALLESGIGEGDIYTSSYSVSHQIERLSNKSPGERKYFVRNSIIITSKNIKKTGEIITSLEKSGINNIQSLNFTSSVRKNYEKEAMILAYKDAKEKAQAIADLEGYSIAPMSINSSFYSPRNINYSVQSEALLKSDPAPIYSPETVNITGNINATFQLKK